ncbi:MAG: endonuclease MutS2 [Ruminococcaceae bacterium]|nr:endonuclease MutS2 [Oscillospiraceae bacterium]
MKEIKRSIRALELDKVLALLSKQASLDDTVELCGEILPEFSLSQVKNSLAKTGDAYNLIARFGAPSFGSAKNVNSYLSNAKAGAGLSPAALLQIGEVLRVIRSVREWKESNAGISTTLDGYFSVLAPNKYFEERIFFCIKNEDEINDNASTTLSDIRRKLKNSAANIKSRLEQIIRSPSHAAHLQDALITQRQGRYVVPVKAEHRSQIPGLVHDTSSSGATLFIEPMSVVEINNEIKVLNSKEKEEIERILAELSAEAAQFADSIITSYNALVELDMCFAKANLAYSMKASMPKINDNGKIYLKNARHPLIPKKDVVPITVTLGEDYRVLVITGPNTGGKTVSLKTIGLFSLMACCGLMLPVDDNSEIAVFDGVYADIGDEQSIEQSLSTFSSHMNHIISILQKADQNSLVLFDELCSGTDPVEGAALSTAILTELMTRKTTVVATTHYAELKAFALDTAGVQNACCEFDVETLKPTYRLLLGIPGRSNAFAISKRLGLENRLVELAEKFVSEDNRRFETIVGQLEQAHIAAEKDKAEINRIKSELEQSRKAAGDRLHEIQVQKDKLMEQARQKANEIIESAREQSNRLLNEIEDLKKQLNKQNSNDMAQKARALAKQTIRGMEKNVDANDKKDDFVAETPNRSLVAGDRVQVRGFSKEALVDSVSDNGKTIFVVIGSLKTKVSINDVKLIKGGDNKPKTRNVKGITPKSQRSASRELDIRGFASDEGVLELDKFLDEAVLAGVETVTIIHGKGTGVLKKAVRAHLKNHPSVAASRPGLYGEGEDGVTIVEIK